MAVWKKKSLQVSNVGESVEGALDASVGVDVGSATVENSAEVPQRKKDRVNIWFSNSASGYLPEENENTT